MFESINRQNEAQKQLEELEKKKNEIEEEKKRALDLIRQPKVNPQKRKLKKPKLPKKKKAKKSAVPEKGTLFSFGFRKPTKWTW